MRLLSAQTGPGCSVANGFTAQLPAVQLAQCFIKDNAGGAGQVEAADCAARRRNRQGATAEASDHLGGQAMSFAAEQEAIAILIADARVDGFGSGREGKDAKRRAAGVGPSPLERGVGVVPAHVNGVPVIEPGAAQRAIIQPEAQAADQMQSRAGRGAQAGDVTCVGRNFGFQERDVQQG
jgi:hypothetical protein